VPPALCGAAAVGAPLHDLTVGDLAVPDVVFQIGPAAAVASTFHLRYGRDIRRAWPRALRRPTTMSRFPSLAGQLRPPTGPYLQLRVAYAYPKPCSRRASMDSQVTLVVRDWGSALGCHWVVHAPPAARRGIAYMEQRDHTAAVMG